MRSELSNSIVHIISIFSSSVLVDQIPSNEQEDPDLFVYISYLTPPVFGTIGSAWVSTVCFSNNLNVNGGTNNGKGFRTSISLWLRSDLQCAEVT